MPPKRPSTGGTTLHELGISDIDCGLDPDGMLDSPPVDEVDFPADIGSTDEDASGIGDDGVAR